MNFFFEQLDPIVSNATLIANNLYSITSDRLKYTFRLFEWDKLKYLSFYVDDVCCVTFTIGDKSFREISLRIDSSQSIEIDDQGNRFDGCPHKSCAVGSFYNNENIITYQGIKKDNLETGFGISYFEDMVTPVIKYIGFFYKGKRQGPGILYDRRVDKQGIVGMGIWMDDQLLESSSYSIGCKEDINRISENIQHLSFFNNSFENVPITQLISNFTQLKSLTIGNNCCKNVRSFALQHFPHLESVVVGRECFLPPISQSYMKSSQPHTLTFSDLPQLKSISIEKESFSWIKQLELSELPKLETLILGSIESAPWDPNFGTFDWTLNFRLISLDLFSFVIV